MPETALPRATVRRSLIANIVLASGVVVSLIALMIYAAQSRNAIRQAETAAKAELCDAANALWQNVGEYKRQNDRGETEAYFAGRNRPSSEFKPVMAGEPLNWALRQRGDLQSSLPALAQKIVADARNDSARTTGLPAAYVTDVVSPGGQRHVACLQPLGTDAESPFVAVSASQTAFQRRSAELRQKFVADSGLWTITLPFVALTAIVVLLAQGLIFLVEYRAMRSGLEGVRSGKASRLGSEFPREFDQIVGLTNGLLETNEKLLTDTRSLINKIAHDVNNKLQALILAIDSPEIDRTNVRRQIAGLKSQIDRYGQFARVPRGGAEDRWRAQRLDLVVFAAEMLQMQRFDLSSAKKRFRLCTDGAAIDVDSAAAGEVKAAMEMLAHSGDLEILFANLLSNASKYGDGLVEVRLARAADVAVIEVHDNGPGIALEDRVRIFGEGVMLNADQKLPGTGFGLDIVQMVVTRMNGTVSVDESDLGGACFRVSIPIGVF